MGWFKRRRRVVPDPRLEFDADGRLTAASLAAVRKAAKAGHVGAVGTFASLQGDLDRAESYWLAVAALDGRGSADAMLELARLALGRGDHAAAARWIEPVLGQDDVYPVTALGVAFRDHGDEATALRLFHAAIGRGDPWAMDYAARIYAARGESGHAAELRGRAADLRTVEAIRQPPILGL
ncbi:hypothetical protein ABZS66_30780 [Dactylosporangium sp. NPDC005572]|uniref:tetratricopeptide repeat protein n=1 Tax=Dactylosporangium sp. NPDC005572 TaxID=3156889 RepID=UPI0033A872BB